MLWAALITNLELWGFGFLLRRTGLTFWGNAKWTAVLAFAGP